MAKGTLKSWWANLERSSSRVGRMIAPKSCSPMIASNLSRDGHNSTPLNWKKCWVGIQNSMETHIRGSFTLIWWKIEIQEKLRGMKESLKLRLRLLIHIETSKGANSTIVNLTECFLGLNHILWRFGSLPRLFYSERSWLGFFCLVACIRMVLDAYAWSTPTYTCVYACAGSLRFHITFPIWSVTSIPRLPSWLLWPKGLLKVDSSLDFHTSKRKRKGIARWNKKHTYPKFPWVVK